MCFWQLPVLFLIALTMCSCASLLVPVFLPLVECATTLKPQHLEVFFHSIVGQLLVVQERFLTRMVLRGGSPLLHPPRPLFGPAGTPEDAWAGVMNKVRRVSATNMCQWLRTIDRHNSIHPARGHHRFSVVSQYWKFFSRAVIAHRSEWLPRNPLTPPQIPPVCEGCFGVS